jgi:hypothetical protein
MRIAIVIIACVTALAGTRDARDLISAMAAITVYIAPESSSLSSLALDSCIQNYQLYKPLSPCAN